MPTRFLMPVFSVQLSLVSTDGEDVLPPLLVEEMATEAPRVVDQNLVHDRYAR